MKLPMRWWNPEPSLEWLRPPLPTHLGWETADTPGSWSLSQVRSLAGDCSENGSVPSLHITQLVLLKLSQTFLIPHWEQVPSFWSIEDIGLTGCPAVFLCHSESAETPSFMLITKARTQQRLCSPRVSCCTLREQGCSSALLITVWCGGLKHKERKLKKMWGSTESKGAEQCFE